MKFQNKYIYVRVDKDGHILETKEVCRGHPPSGFVKIKRESLNDPSFEVKKVEVKNPNLITLIDVQKHLMPIRMDKIENRVILIECDIVKKNKIIDEKINYLKCIPKVEIRLLSGDVSVWKSKTAKTPDIFIPAMITI